MYFACQPFLSGIRITKSSPENNNNISHIRIYKFSDSINVHVGPNLSEDSDSDHPSFEPSNKSVSRSTLQQKSNCASIIPSAANASPLPTSRYTQHLTSSATSQTLSKSAKESTLAGYQEKSISMSPNCNANLQNSEVQGFKKPIRDSNTTKENGSSSDSTSNTDTSDSESSSDEDEHCKEKTNKRHKSMENKNPNNRAKCTVMSPSKFIPSEGPEQVSCVIAPNTVLNNSPFDSTSVSFSNLESGADIADGDLEKDGDGEGYGLDVFYKKVIKSTHSPHSQPSPKISQVRKAMLIIKG